MRKVDTKAVITVRIKLPIFSIVTFLKSFIFHTINLMIHRFITESHTDFTDYTDYIFFENDR